MRFFERDDGTAIEVVPGYRDRVLNYRRGFSPRESWGDHDYAEAAARRRRRFERIARDVRTFGPSLPLHRVLDVGCGDASNCILFAESGVSQVVGIDLDLSLFADTEKGRRTRRLAAALAGVPGSGNVREDLARRGVTLEHMDATRMSLPDATFDFVMSRSAMEHVRPAEAALREIVRVTRPGGLIYLGIDPFYWLRGCHKRGVADIPWAHARLTLGEYQRFVSLYEGPAKAAQRHERLETLNRFTLEQWHEKIRAMGCVELQWLEDASAVGQEHLRERPEVLKTLLPGVAERDLLHERIHVWLRRP